MAFVEMISCFLYDLWQFVHSQIKKVPALGMPPARIVLLTQTRERKQAEASGLPYNTIGAIPRNRAEKTF